MRFLILLAFLLCLESFAEYEKGKIDMHGGKDESHYEKKSSFSKTTFGVSMFLDKNTSKEKKPIQK